MAGGAAAMIIPGPSIMVALTALGITTATIPTAAEAARMLESLNAGNCPHCNSGDVADV